jgi:hypothetical protein
MVTAKEYFEKDLSRVLRVHAVHSVSSADGTEAGEVIAAVGLDFESAARFGALLVPPVSFVAAIVRHYLENIGEVLKVADGVDVSSGLSGTTEHILLRDLQFTGRLFVYTQAPVPPDTQTELMELGSHKGVKLVLRDGTYMNRRSELQVPMAFISHDSRDKDPFVRDLANTLQKMLCTVWYDEYSLVAGQSLRASIEKGLKECKKCVLVLSPNFIGNEGWTKAEFDSIFTREILEKQNVIVPVWLGVTKEDVYEYSPRLLDKVGIPATLGVEEVCRRILRALPSET